jgi:N utilization substance protein B
MCEAPRAGSAAPAGAAHPQAGRSNAAARRRARRFLLQSLYQQAMTGAAAAEVEQQFRQDHDMQRADLDYYHELLVGIEREAAGLLAEIATVIDRPLGRLDPVETAILKLGTYELLRRVDVPFRVVINEGVELARAFGAADSHKYINSVLDALARRHRKPELDGQS